MSWIVAGWIATSYLLTSLSASAVTFDPPRVLQGGIGFMTVLTLGPEDPDPSTNSDGCIYAAHGSEGSVRRICFDAAKAVTSDTTVIDINGSGSVEALLGITIDPELPNGEIHVYLAYADNLDQPYNGKIARAVSTDGGTSFAVDEQFITGLGRSKGNIQTNGLEFGPDWCLYVAQGGNSNAGYDADHAELRLSASILRACFKDGNGNVDPSFDRNCGAGNVQLACDVEVYASGFRNPFDLAWHSNGRLYATDNDTSLGFRNTCPDVANTFGCPCQTPLVDPIGDELNLIEFGAYYGHPNPYLANPSALQCQGGTAPGFACSIDANCGGGGTCEDLSGLCTDPLCGDTAQCYYFGWGEPPVGNENQSGIYRQPLAQTPALLDGITEYRSRFPDLHPNSFCSDWDGHLLTAGSPGPLHRFIPLGGGSSVSHEGTTNLESAAGLDLTVGADGTIYIADLDGGRIVYLRPVVQPDSAAPDYFDYCGSAAPIACGDLLSETFEEPAGSDPSGWLDTAANSLEPADDFQIQTVDGESVFGTSSSETNIHSHYVSGGANGWSGPQFEGRFRLSTSQSGIGVTFLSSFPFQDRYYRLRRHGGFPQFHLSTHGTSIVCDFPHTGVTPLANEWYRFSVKATFTGTETQLRAKVWNEAGVEPQGWQQECTDSGPDQLTMGTIGVWSMGPGTKYWDDFSVQIPDAPSIECNDGDLCNGMERCNSGFCVRGSPLDCDDGDACTIDSCDSALGCFPGGSLQCEDGNECTTDACDSALGCVYQALDGSVCDDGIFCNGADTCREDRCGGSAIPCQLDEICDENNDACVPPVSCLVDADCVDEGNPCTDHFCNGGLCAVGWNTGLCDDGDARTISDSCVNGLCSGAEIECSGELTRQEFEAFDGIDPANWIDTGKDNSLTPSNDFAAFFIAGRSVLGTASTDANVHSHYITPGSSEWTNYTLTGLLRISDSRGGVGVTLFSDYTTSDSYYRLRRYSGFPELHLSVHGSSLNCDTPSTGISPLPDVWYEFKMTATDTGNETLLQARVWPEGSPEPNVWQQQCTDSGSSRRTAGNIGVWSAGDGEKYWDDITASENSATTTECDDGSFCNGVEFCNLDARRCESGARPVCNDGNSCTSDSCSASGGCVFTPQDGEACNDGVFCNGVDTCAGDTCIPAVATPCAPGELCDEDLAACFPPCVSDLDCSDGDECNGDETCNTQSGGCEAGAPPVCPGNGDVCTDALCVTGVGCAEVDNTAPCDDGDANTVNDTCMQGSCAGHIPLVCQSSRLDEQFPGPTGSDPLNWFDTGPDNSLAPSDDFQIFTVDGEQVLGTVATELNFHSHYLTASGEEQFWSDYTFTGRMRMDSAGGAIGVTVLSDYTNADHYYRFRRELASHPEFHLSQHGTTNLFDFPNSCLTPNTGVVPVAGTWYLFRVEVEDLGTETQLRAKVWPQAEAEPATWQHECADRTTTRRSQGTVGVWAMGSGAKYWDDFKVEANDATVCDDGLFCSGVETCAAGLCASSGDPCAGGASPVCDDSIDQCVGCLGDSDCVDDGAFCTGVEICLSGACTSVGDPCAAGGEICDEDRDTCIGCATDFDCASDGLFCTGAEICQSEACVSVGDPCESGPQPLCDEVSDLCVDCLDDLDCLDDGLFCSGVERCQLGACASDGDPCSGLVTCDESIDACVPAGCTSDQDCTSDGQFCNGSEICQAGVCVSPGDPCAGGPQPACNETSDLCVECLVDGDCVDDGVFCNGGEVCQAGSCASKGDPCFGGPSPACDEAGGQCLECLLDGDCLDDGLYCSGPEVCQAGVCGSQGTPCSAGQSCDEAQDACVQDGGALLEEDFDTYDVGDDPQDWIDTGSGNSTSEADDFEVIHIAGDPAFGTSSGSVNIHSHYVGAGADGWASHTFTGRMRVSSTSGGIGVTLVSGYPASEGYYRLRRYGRFREFHLSTHGSTLSCDSEHTGISPAAHQWYRFEIHTVVTGTETELRAKIWPDGSAEPSGWQQVCTDGSGSRRTSGTVGVWTMGNGTKYFDDLRVVQGP